MLGEMSDFFVRLNQLREQITWLPDSTGSRILPLFAQQRCVLRIMKTSRLFHLSLWLYSPPPLTIQLNKMVPFLTKCWEVGCMFLPCPPGNMSCNRENWVLSRQLASPAPKFPLGSLSTVVTTAGFAHYEIAVLIFPLAACFMSGQTERTNNCTKEPNGLKGPII